MAGPALAPSPALLAALHETLLSGERQSSAVRPEIAGYLLDHGLAPLHASLSADGESPDALCAEVWRLMLASVSARRFGVSTDAWRENDDYPDRYFPLLWLVLVPAALPAMPAVERLPCVAALFNLGEQLSGPLRATGNRLMAGLAGAPGALAPAWRAALERAMVQAGLLALSVTPPAAWRTYTPVARFDFAAVEPAFLPDTAVAAEARAFRVGSTAGVGVLLADSGGLTLLGVSPGAPAEATTTLDLAGGRLSLDGRRLMWRPPGAAQALCLAESLPLVAPAALAANEAGDVLLVDAASAQVTLGRCGA
jgi:hypothetical protein